MTAPIRHMRPGDVQGAMLLTAAASWNQTEHDWLRMLALAPDGCFCVECDGVVAATATAICYGRDLAWVGMVLTAPEYRGRGFARSLMIRTLEFLDARGVSQVKLDATGMGSPLYQSLGFVEECPIERWTRPPGPVTTTPEALEAGFDAALDHEAFGADRSELLRQLARDGAAAVPGAGFAMDRPGRNAAYFGPCVAASECAARRLAEWFLARHDGEPACWDLLPDNAAAVRVAAGLGFSPVRRLTRMTLGRDQAAARSVSPDIFAIAGFEYG